MQYSQMPKEELRRRKKQLDAEFETLKKMNLKLDMSRGSRGLTSLTFPWIF